MATANNHKVLLTFPWRNADDTPNAADATTGRIWLYGRDGRPVSSSSTVTAPGGGAVTLGSGGLVKQWANVAVNTDHTQNGNPVGAYVSPSLWANVGTTGSPADHILVDGKDGSYYVAEVVYSPATGRPRSARFEFQVSAQVDYAAASNTVSIGGSDVVLVSALDDKTVGTGNVEAIIAALIASTAGNQSVTSGAGAPSSTPAAVGDVYIDTSNDVAYIATGTASSADWDQATGGAGGISNVVEDVTPQLGGPLDVNGQELTGAIDLHSTGDVVLELGDAAGTNKVSVRDSAGTEQAAVDSDGNITTAGTVDGRDVAADGSKLDGIETGATADQTAADIRALGFFDTTNDGTGSGLDADTVDGIEGAALLQNVVEDVTPQLGGPLDVNGQELTGAIDLHSTGDVVLELGDAAGTNKVSVRDSAGTEQAAVDSDGNITTAGTVDGRDVAADGSKLDGIEAGADVTDTANVTAAGALMDSEVDADLKTLALPANTTISAFGASLVDDADASAARTTLGVAIGSDVQGYDAELAAIAGLTSAADKGILFTGSGTASTIDVTSLAQSELAGMAVPQTVTGTTDTLAAADKRRLTLYSNAAQVTVTVPTAQTAGDWYLLQSTGAGGVTLTTTGLTLNGSSPNTTIAQNEAMLIVYTATSTISIIGATAA